MTMHIIDGFALEDEFELKYKESVNDMKKLISEGNLSSNEKKELIHFLMRDLEEQEIDEMYAKLKSCCSKKEN